MKQRTTVYLDHELIAGAKAFKVNISEVCNIALRRELGDMYTKDRIESLKKELKAMDILSHSDDNYTESLAKLQNDYNTWRTHIGELFTKEYEKNWIQARARSYPSVRRTPLEDLRTILSEFYKHHQKEVENGKREKMPKV